MNSLVSRWPLDGLDTVRDALLAAYGAGDRGYHDLLHLAEVLDRLDELAAHETFDVRTVGLAAWFHDGVYDGEPGAEDRSAVWAERALEDTDLGPEVARLVRLTEHHRPTPGDTSGAALCDADLAILAAPPERYATYAAGVRQEYARYDDATFATGRTAVLRELVRGEIFTTSYARHTWQAAARDNVEREIAALGAPPDVRA
ncbi:MAG: hypothetical protein ACI379_07490 [Nocardioides sp.]|uniref:HD domain-containing protein n=1 Tax=Nocardioides sp. TaxID=35761 RepID=UPI003F057566